MSPKSEAKGIEALEALLMERRRHEGYLAKLEERRETTPAHVYARLRDEYVTKLTDLQVRAAAEAEALSSGIEHDEAAVAEIEAKLAEVIEERIEGELRAEVGEYEPKEWSKKLTVLNATISQLEKERDARAGVFERTRGLLTEATGYAAPPASASPDPAPAAPAHRPSSPRVAVPDPGAPAVDKPSSGPSKPASMAGPSFDELAFLNSVVGRASAPVPQAPPPRTPTPARPQADAPPPPTSAPEVARAEAPAPAPEPAAEVAVPEPAVARPEPTAPSPAPIREPATAPRGPTGAPPSLPMQEPSFSSPPPSAEDEPPSPLGRPTPRTSQAIKTLKCQECGTLNYPTEWYCERCGGELAAL